MRQELRNVSEFDHWRDVPDFDFAHALELARKFIAGQFHMFEEHASKVRAEEPILADDILDDIGYYTFIDAQFVWHFVLWRIQGLFESMMVYGFLGRANSRGLLGLEAKLKAMLSAGFPLEDVDRDEIVSWGHLRNALSHAPPKSYSPGPLTEGDVVEYLNLVLRVKESWSRHVSVKRDG